MSSPVGIAVQLPPPSVVRSSVPNSPAAQPVLPVNSMLARLC